MNALPGTQALIREAEGLALLASTLAEGGLHIPEVVSVTADRLELEYIEAVPPTPMHGQVLGLELAKLHSVAQAAFGFPVDNFIGLNPQKNAVSDSWGEFFVEYRLDYQLSLMSDVSRRRQFCSHLQRYRHRLIEYLNHHCAHSSLVHGDLWSGNVLFGAHNRVWLIDPAVYYGDREADIAMTEMFGGFPPSFYTAYQQHSPLTEAYPIKKSLYNLYHYLNHYNLFGNSYLPPCEQALETLAVL